MQLCIFESAGSFQHCFHGTTVPSEPGPPHYWRFTITLRHTTLYRTPVEEWSARRRDIYMTTHTIHTKQTSMPLARFEPTIPVCEQPQIHALGRAATEIGSLHHYVVTSIIGIK